MKLAQARVHFIGIGGIGMCGLAELLHNMGAKVTGSDIAENANVVRLRELGLLISIGHEASNIGKAEVVVYSSAVKSDNPEFREARKLKIPLIPRAEALAEMMRIKRGVAIGGSHGKTTTTSLAASIFLEAGVKPTIVVGGRLDLIKSTALLGEGQWLVAEADESDGSFLKLAPEIVVITNIDNDHLDHYGNIENLKKAYYDFAMKIPFYGLAIVCGDDPLVREVFADFPKRIMFYGFDPSSDLRLEGEKGSYSIYREGKLLGDFKLQVPGKHNALNACAALAAGLEAGFAFATCARGLSQFGGVDRRFQYKGSLLATPEGFTLAKVVESDGSGDKSIAASIDGSKNRSTDRLANKDDIQIYDDYGHHPTEVRAVLQAFREKFPDRRLITVFQPHRYSRTQLCWNDFTECFENSDLVYICDIYAAGEKPIAGITTESLCAAIKNAKAIHLKGDLGPDGKSTGYLERAAIIRQSLKSGDIVVTLGAGDIWKLGMELLSPAKK